MKRIKSSSVTRTQVAPVGLSCFNLSMEVHFIVLRVETFF